MGARKCLEHKFLTGAVVKKFPLQINMDSIYSEDNKNIIFFESVKQIKLNKLMLT